MYLGYKNGWIEVITGCMFAGKTEELLRRIRILSFVSENIQVFKPKIDVRYLKDKIVSHNKNFFQAISILNGQELLEKLNTNTEVVAIDEIQFFNLEILSILELLANKGVRVIVAGIDKDFRGEPFAIMSELLARAEFVTKLEAICVKCKQPATRTQRIIDNKPANYNDPIIFVGESDFYEARCRHCHIVNNKPKINSVINQILKE